MKYTLLLLTLVLGLLPSAVRAAYLSREWDEDVSAALGDTVGGHYYVVEVGSASGTASTDPYHGSGLTVTKDGTVVTGYNSVKLGPNLICKTGNPTTNLPPTCPDGNANGDNKAVYDWTNDRFIVAGLEGHPFSSYYIAFSESNDPTGNWYVYEIPFGTNPPITDNPLLGTSAYWAIAQGVLTSDSSAPTYLFDLVDLEAGNDLKFTGTGIDAWQMAGDVGDRWGVARVEGATTGLTDAYSFSTGYEVLSGNNHPEIVIDRYTGTEFFPTVTRSWKTVDATTINTGGLPIFTGFDYNGCAGCLALKDVTPHGEVYTANVNGNSHTTLVTAWTLTDGTNNDGEGIVYHYDITQGALKAINTHLGLGGSAEIMEMLTAPEYGSNPDEVLIGGDWTDSTDYPSFTWQHWFPNGTTTTGATIAGTSTTIDTALPQGRWSDFEPDCGDYSPASSQALFCGHVAIPGPPNSYFGCNTLPCTGNAKEINVLTFVN